MIVTLEELLKRLEPLRKAGKKVVFTNGCFDLLHAGHADYLSRAKELGDVLVVGLNSDDSVRRLKGPGRPVLPQEMRAYLLSQLKPVDFVVVFDEDTPERLIRAVRPDVLVKGGDWPLEKVVGRAFVESYGGKVLTLPFRYDVSTSKIIKTVLERYCDK
ncbi:MAG: D-glycero-beta-D-manno-heptose 1-phosphate adenylyltransferase [Aquificae bacterium]|nr:D-glycero-beta-D-manno-heptose 1-phosphate adenylyltransferase [Aquificota bacterium]